MAQKLTSRRVASSCTSCSGKAIRASYGHFHHCAMPATLTSCLLCSGLPPFYGRSEKEIFSAILHGRAEFESNAWHTVSPEAKDLVHRCPCCFLLILAVLSLSCICMYDQLLSDCWRMQHASLCHCVQ